MIRVQFTAKVSPWNIGETAAFDDSKAMELIGRGIATMVDVSSPKVETVEAVVDQTPMNAAITNTRGRPRKW